MHPLLLTALFSFIVGCGTSPAQKPTATVVRANPSPTPSSRPPPRLTPDAAQACVASASEPVTLANWANQVNCKDAAQRIYLDCQNDYGLGRETCLNGCNSPEWVTGYTKQYEFPLWCKLTRDKCSIISSAHDQLGEDDHSRGARQIRDLHLDCVTLEIIMMPKSPESEASPP